MKPKGKLFALVAVFAAIGLVTATGAFTSVQAQRTADVNVAGDANALLQLTPASPHASIGGNGQLSIAVDNLNNDARTDLGPVFNITNNGDDEVTVQIADESSEHNSAGFGDTNDIVTFMNANASSPSSIEASTNNEVTLSPGQGFTVKVVIDIGDESVGDLINGEIVIIADQS
jgi:hypothetical protein